jgi:hypothetical protein
MSSDLKDYMEELIEAFEEANSLCRSMNSIAERNGEYTNWEAFRKRLSEALVRQHSILYYR